MIDLANCKFGFIVVVLAFLLSGCASDPVPIQQSTSRPFSGHHNYRRAYNRPYRIRGQTYYPMTSPDGYSEIGVASWYGSESGSTTSMGLPFYPEGISAAHKTLPLPSKVKVTNLNNGRSIIVKVNDRGPFKPNRIIDLSHGAAKKIGIKGLGHVKIEYLGYAD
jgi:rare lipoprotein A